MKTSARRLVVRGIALCAVTAVGILLLPWPGPFKSRTAPQPEAAVASALPVPVETAVKTRVSMYYEYPARTEAIMSIALQTKITGYIQEQVAGDGSDVRKGDLLYRVDPRDFRAKLDQAAAQMRRNEAALRFAKVRFERGQELLKSGALTRDAFDERVRAVEEAAAALQEIQAALRTAELELSYTEIAAPFAGRLGLNRAPVGALIGAGSSVLNTLIQIDPLYVTFSPSETELPEIVKAVAKGTIKAEVTLPGRPDPLSGDLSFINNTVDKSTGTIVVRLTLRNERKSLLPGQYVKVKLIWGETSDAILVPEAALGSSQAGKHVYVVGKDDKAELRVVKLGQRVGTSVAVVEGLDEKERIITGNLQRLSSGVRVAPKSDAS